MNNQLEPNNTTRIEHVGRTGIYPISGPTPQGPVVVRGQGALAHPEERRQPAFWTGQSADTATLLLGRLLFGGFFLTSGLQHFADTGTLISEARRKKVPAPRLAVLASGALITLGGLSLLMGRKPKIGAGMIAAFLLGVTPRMHNFWQIANQQERKQEMINFMKNVALVGGAALAACVPEPWPASPHLFAGALGKANRSSSEALVPVSR